MSGNVHLNFCSVAKSLFQFLEFTLCKISCFCITEKRPCVFVTRTVTNKKRFRMNLAKILNSSSGKLLYNQ